MKGDGIMAIAPLLNPNSTLGDVQNDALHLGSYYYGINNTVLSVPVKACGYVAGTGKYLYFGTTSTETISAALIQWRGGSSSTGSLFSFSQLNNNIAFMYYYGTSDSSQAGEAINAPIDPIFYELSDVFSYLGSGIPYPITYRLTNATTTGPNEAAVGDTVTVPLTFPAGYGVVNPSSDAYVTCNGVLVPSTYSDGQLVFTMPDPS